MWIDVLHCANVQALSYGLIGEIEQSVRENGTVWSFKLVNNIRYVAHFFEIETHFVW